MLYDEERLASLLKTARLPHCFLLFGNDPYLTAFYADKIRDATVGEALRFFNLHTFEGEAPPETVFETAEMLPVMSERRCIVLKDYPFPQLNKEDAALFLKGVAELPDTTVLVMVYTAVAFSSRAKEDIKWKPLIDAFEKAGAAAELNHRSPAKTRQMLVRGAAKRGTSITPALADELIAVTGDDINNLLNEFNKLCAYADGKPVTAEMIAQVAVKSVAASVFDISAAIFSGKPERAFEIMQELLRQKTPVQPILGALALAYVNVYRYLLAKREGYGPADFAEAFGYKGNYSYTFSKLAPFAGRFTPQEISRALDVLLAADVKSKSTQTDPETLLTELIATLAALVGEKNEARKRG